MIINGFKYNAVEANIRKRGRLDLGLICCDEPAVAAAVFTTNKVKAAPVLLGIERVMQGKVQALMVNSGIANACTGSAGMTAAVETGRIAAATLQIPEELIMVSSTGVIGQQLDVSRFAAAMPALAAGLAPDGYDRVARAMMTTDTVPKTASRTVAIYGKKISLFAIAKGSGMIMPDMATMLCFVMTDAAIGAADLKVVLKKAVDETFNRITVDGDTSTNDTVLVMANGRAGNADIEISTSAMAVFEEALTGLLRDLALQIVADGEGATKLVTIRVAGAHSQEEAVLAARTIANSPLVKTAFFGEDANWGRIIGALGRSGADFDPDHVDIAFDHVLMVQKGLGLGSAAEAAATEILRQKRFTVTIDLHHGQAQAEYYTCDFSIDYVKINADYRS